MICSLWWSRCFIISICREAWKRSWCFVHDSSYVSIQSCIIRYGMYNIDLILVRYFVSYWHSLYCLVSYWITYRYYNKIISVQYSIEVTNFDFVIDVHRWSWRMRSWHFFIGVCWWHVSVAMMAWFDWIDILRWIVRRWINFSEYIFPPFGTLLRSTDHQRIIFFEWIKRILYLHWCIIPINFIHLGIY